MSEEIYEELSRYDSDSRAKIPFSNLPSTKDLGLGVWICELTGHRLTARQNDGKPVLTFVLLARQSGTEEVLVEHSFHLGGQEAVDRLLGELTALGVDSDQWTLANKRPFSSELQKLLASKKLIGLRFQARRREYESGGQAGWAFDFCGVLKSKPSQAAAIASQALARAAAPRAPAPTRQAAPVTQHANAHPSGGASEEVPFGRQQRLPATEEDELPF